MRVLVTGATGNVGRPTLEALRERSDLEVVAGLRPGSNEELSVPTVPVDFRDPGTWDTALDDVQGVFLLRPPAISDVGPTLNAFIDRGVEVGSLEHVVFLSVVGAARVRVIPHARIEAHLQAGPTPWTFLRAGFFAQNLCGPYRRDIAEDDRLYVPAGRGQVAWVDTRDLGEAAARAFFDPDAMGSAWVLTGPEACTYEEVAARLGAALGRPIDYKPASLPGYLLHLMRRRGLELTPSLIYATLHLAIRFGAEGTVDPTLERVLGRRPRTVTDTIRDHLHLWQAGAREG